MRGIEGSASTGSQSRVRTVGRSLGSQGRLRQGLSLMVVLGLSLIASACERVNTHDAGSTANYDATFATTGDSYTIGDRPDHMAEVGTYSGDKLATAHYDGQDQEGQQDSQARGTYNVSTNPGYEGYYGAAFYFQPGTLSGTASAPAKQKGRVDILQWDNAPTYGAANKDIGGIRIADDHVAHLFWDGPNDPETTIGTGFLLREGCWNWVFVKQKGGDAGAAKNDLYLNGEKLFSVTDKNITTGRSVERVHYGLPRIDEAPQAGTPLDIYVDDAHVGATNASIVPPRATACEPQTGARPYYKLEDQELNDRMGIGVNVASGNLLVSADDLQIAGTELDLTVSRTYNSARLEDTKMGAGWNLSGGSDVSVRYGSEGQAIFRGATGERVTFKKNGSDYDSPKGYRDLKLTKNGDGTSQLELLADRTKLNFHSELASSQGALSSIVDASQNTITFNYNTNGVLQSITDPQDRIVTVTTDSSGRVRGLRDFDTPTPRNWTYNINSEGELDSYADPENSASTLYDYNGPRDRLTKIRDPNLIWTEIEYENTYPYRVKRIIRLPGHADTGIWRFDYSTDAATCGSDVKGNPRGKTVVTDPNDHPTTYCWDQLGIVHRVRDAKGNERNTAYDTDANVTEFSHGTAISNASYFDKGRLKDVTSPTGAKTTFTYNAPDPNHSHLPDTVTDARQQVAHFEYGANKLTKMVDPLGNETTLTYNPNGTLKSVIPPRGKDQGLPDANPYATRYTYTNGNLTTIDRPAPLGDEIFTYDSLSRVKTRTDGNGHVQTYAYDKLDLVQEVTYKNSAGGPVVSSIQFDYDSNGNLICRGENGNCEDPSAVETDYQYDGRNRLKLEDFPGTGVEGDTLYTYDAAGNLKTFQESESTHPTITYTYDEVNNLTKLRDPGGLETTFGYDARDNRERTTYPNGVQIDQTFDLSDRIRTIVAKKGTTDYVNLQYFFRDALPGDTWPANCPPQPAMDPELRQCEKDNVAGTTTKYTYDPAGRLTAADTTGGSSPVDYNYGYDANSNRTQQQVVASSGTTTTNYAYGFADELCWAFSGSPGSCTPGTAPVGSTTYSFDSSGNQTGFSGGCQMSYNTRDQNTSVTGCGGANSMSAEYLGPSNVERVVSDDVKFVNSALGLVKRDNANDSGSPVYFRRDDEGKLVQALRSGDGGAFRNYYYIHDALGSVIALTDGNGDLMRTYSYDPYGTVTDTDRSAGQNAPTDRFRFVAEYQGSGFLYHLAFRFYDPRIGRFTQVDPIEQAGQSRYMYVGGDPMNRMDPTGLSQCGRKSGCAPVGKLGRRIQRIARRQGNRTFWDVLDAACGIAGLKAAHDEIKSAIKRVPRSIATKAGAATAGGCAVYAVVRLR